LSKARLKQHPGHTILKLNNKILKYNRNPKLLRVTLDEKLNFGQLIQNIEKKAGNSLGMLRVENMQYSVLSALILIFHFLLHSIISLMSFCIHSETSTKLSPQRENGLKPTLEYLKGQ
jgi:hypothetical protein